MIQRLNISNKKNYPALLDFIKNNTDEDFYYTLNNERVYIEDAGSLKKLLKSSRDIYELEEGGDCVAFCLLWKSIGGEKTRYYIKLLAKDSNSASDLLRGFLWQIYNTEIFVKISKHHRFLDVYKKYGFKFIGGRGRQVLLKRDKFIREHNNYNSLALKGIEDNNE
jgi:hypothetical protein